MNVKKVALMAIMSLAGAMALAQDGGPGGPPPGGGFGPPGMGRGGPGGMNNPLFLLSRHDVQVDLKLTSEQIDKLNDLRETMRPQGGPGGGPGGPGGGPGGEGGPGGGGPGGEGGPGGPPPDMAGGQGGPGGPPPADDSNSDDRFKAMEKRMKEMREKQDAAINKILTTEQQKRLKEIAIQLGGNAALLDATVQKSLSLSDEQKLKIKSLQTSQQKANRSVMEKARNGDIEFDQVRKIMDKNQKSLDKSLGELLTDAQKAKLKALGGAPFKEEKETDNQG